MRGQNRCSGIDRSDVASAVPATASNPCASRKGCQAHIRNSLAKAFNCRDSERTKPPDVSDEVWTGTEGSGIFQSGIFQLIKELDMLLFFFLA